MDKNTTKAYRTLQAVMGATGMMVLFIISRHNYLLFHSLTELFSIAVAWSVFLLVWNTRRIADNDALLFLGIAYFFIGFIDLFHTLAYKGMNVFAQDMTPNSATQLWIAARGLEASSLLVFPFVLSRRFQYGYMLAGYTALTAVLLASILIWNTFPDCYIEAHGLTAFKKGAEYAICLVLALAMALLFRRQGQLDTAVFRLMISAMAVTIAAELAFTLYTDVYGLSNAAGHFLKIISFFLVYMALIRSSVTRPQATVFRELGREKEALAKEERQLRLLQQVSALFLRSDTLDGTLIELPNVIATHFKAPIVAIELHDADRGEMIFVGSTGISVQDSDKLRVPVDQTISGTVANTGRAVIGLDVSDHTDYRAQALKDLNVMTFACVPMVSQDGVIGTLAIADHQERPDIVDSADLIQILAGNLAQEIERRQREMKYRLLMDNTNAGFILFDTKGRYVAINQSAAERLGGRQADFIGKSLRDVLPREANMLLERFAQIIAEKKGAQFEDAFQLPGGTRWFSNDLQPVIGSAGDITGIQVITVDITDRKHAEVERENTIRMLEILNAETDRRDLIRAVLRFMVELSDCEAVGIRLRDGDDFPYYETSGFSDDFVEAETHLCVSDLEGQLQRDEEGNPVLECMCGNILRGRFDPSKPFFTDYGSFISNCTTELLANTDEDDRRGRTRNRCNTEGYESVLLVPLRAGGETFGLLQFNDHREGCFAPPFVDQAERLAGNVAIALAQRKAEERLREERQRLTGIIEGTNAGTWEWNVQTGEAIFNERWAEIIGYTLDEISAASIQTWRQLAHPDDLKQSDALLEKHYHGELDYYECETRMRHKYGAWVWVLDRGRVVSRTEDGKPLMVMGTHQDITERKRAEEELRESEERYQGLVENLPSGVVVHAPDSSVLFANPQASRLLGLTLEQMRGKTAPDPAWSFLRENGTSLPLEEYPVNQVLSSGKPLKSQVVGIRLSGRAEPHWVLCNAYPRFNTSDQILQVVVSFSDITERKWAEEEKEKLQDQLIQAQKMESVGRLAGGVAHDFNNMLGVILGHADMIMDQMDPILPFHADLEEIKQAALRSANLTRQLLAFARKQTVAPRVLDLNKTIKGMLQMLRRLIGEDIDLAWIPGQNIEPITMDPSQIDQILVNLCVNARDAISGVGKVTIKTENSRFNEVSCADHPGFVPGEYVLLTVSDNGCGMNRETLVHLFEPFFTTKELGKGTGLGLATIYGIVRQNNGFVNVFSDPGQGTTFKIYLPRHTGELRPMEVESPAEPSERGHETILLVEDEPAILGMSMKMLQKLGYTVVTASTPGEAMHLAREYAGQISLLITDVVMPEMNGRDLAKNLLSLYPSLKRLFMSGYTVDVIAHRGVLDEGVHFIQKPFSIEDLAAKVREALER